MKSQNSPGFDQKDKKDYDKDLGKGSSNIGAGKTNTGGMGKDTGAGTRGDYTGSNVNKTQRDSFNKNDQIQKDRSKL